MKGPMTTLDRRLLYLLRLYQSLLSLYPKRFQMRFGDEMAQVFRECCEREAADRGGYGLLALWTQTLKDFAISLVSEWHKEVVLPDGAIDYHGLADLFMITVVVGTNLLVWGVTALVTLRPETWTVLTAMVVFIFAIGTGVFCAKLVSRHGRSEPPRIKV